MISYNISFHMIHLTIVLFISQYNDQGLHHNALLAWQNATNLNIFHSNAWNNMILLLDNLGQRIGEKSWRVDGVMKSELSWRLDWVGKGEYGWMVDTEGKGKYGCRVDGVGKGE